ncbi:MAG: hypothetical protein KIT72_03930 [Polyangiaceae bacterium]|nr:hypothetical protein [Polyangiaceae bacterium]MCW5789552.1 hypothetical protein [Polyangiaceae bacterium]
MAALRDHGADDERLAQLWRRLDEELPERPAAVTSGAARLVRWGGVAAAAAVLLFGAGVVVGSRLGVSPEALVSSERGAEATTTDRAAGEEDPAPTPEPPVAPSSESLLPLTPDPRFVPPSRTPKPPATVEVVEPTPVARPVGPPEWQQLADSGEYAAAYQALGQQAGFQRALAQASADQLMTLAEVARANRQRGLATEALRQLLARYPGDPNAPLAALALGNLLEAAGDKRGAAQAFARYRALSPDGDFAEDALARQVMSAIEQGHLTLARKLAAQYEKDYPSGRRAQEMRDALAEAEASDAGAAADEPEADVDAGAAELAPSEGAAPPPGAAPAEGAP